MRTRGDRCPGVLRPWPADDGLLVRIRLVAGRLEVGQLRLLSEAARRFGDGRVRSTAQLLACVKLPRIRIHSSI